MVGLPVVDTQAGVINRAVVNAAGLLNLWFKQAVPTTSPLHELYADWTRKTENIFLAHWAARSRALVQRLVELETKAAADLLIDADWWADWSTDYERLSVLLLEEAAGVGANMAADELQKLYGLGVVDTQARTASWAQSQAGKLAKGLTTTDKRNLKTQLASWTQAKEDLPALIGRVNGFMNNPVRARMIAVTESTRAYARGSINAWYESGVVTGKIWNTAQDEKVCPICGALADQVSNLSRSGGSSGHEIWRHQLDPAMSVGLVTENPPAHTNCRCWLSPWMEDVPPWTGPLTVAEKPALAVPIPKPPPKPKAPSIFPKDMRGLETVRGLGGSTGAELVRDPKSGKLFVLKRGASPEHLHEEVLADAIYRKLGVKVPNYHLYETSGGPVKLAEYIEGDTLAHKLRTASVKELDEIMAALRKDFGADALLGNWDVVGLEADNILIDAKGVAWRIDNGGSLRFRAMGRLKTPDQWNQYVDELWTLRDMARNEQTAGVFGELGFGDIVDQLEAIGKQRRSLLNMIDDPELRAMLGNRLDNIADIAQIGRTLNADKWTWEYVDGFAKHSVGLRQAGIIDALPKKLTHKGVYVYDENKRAWDHLRGRGSVMEDLSKYMQENGASWDTVEYWMGHQAGSSWSGASQAVKYWIAEQRGGNFDDYAWKEGLETARKAFTGAVSKVGAEKFNNSYQQWHVFNFEFLRNTSFARNNVKEGFVELVRTESQNSIRRRAMITGPGVDFYFKRGAAESASIYETVSVNGYGLTLQKVPHHRIMGNYFFERSPGSGGGVFYGDGENEFVFITDRIKFAYVGDVTSGRNVASYWSEWGDRIGFGLGD